MDAATNAASDSGTLTTKSQRARKNRAAAASTSGFRVDSAPPKSTSVEKTDRPVFVERLWRSLKYEEIYLSAPADLRALETGLERWFGRYNDWRPHQHLGNLTPSQVHAGEPLPERIERRAPRQRAA